jgi:hypothetical protein
MPSTKLKYSTFLLPPKPSGLRNIGASSYIVVLDMTETFEVNDIFVAE